jgi:hypothetical protein
MDRSPEYALGALTTMFARVAGFAVGSIMLAISSTASAQLTDQSCAIYHIEQTQGVPPDISAFFDYESRTFYRQTQLDGIAVRRCRNSAGNVISSFLTPVEKHFGTCHYGESDISGLFSAEGRFLLPNSTGYIEVLSDPREHMYATDGGDCPPHDNTNYIFADDVSPGVFRMLVAAYTQMMSSARAFDAALSEANPSGLTRRFAASLKESLRGRFGTAPPLSFISYRPPFIGQSTVGVYHVMMNGGWLLEFEFTQRGLKVIDLSLVNQ